jgi:hypothetical protein
MWKTLPRWPRTLAEFFESFGFFLGAITCGGLIPNQCCRLSADGRSYTGHAVEHDNAKLRVDVLNVILLSGPPTFGRRAHAFDRQRLVETACIQRFAFGAGRS